ncbi:hypothetical protein Tco_0748277 [Tanacetum coccineum]|uniref:DNA-directed RNA polymerase n=1 Tax=Tanacetum coccineum TaxID=301880 RepID=A0ABQ4YXP7_9ASTR
MEEINNFQQEPDETLYQACERFKELLMKYPHHYLTEIQEVILFYNRLDVPTRHIFDSRGAVSTKTAADAKKAIQEMAKYSQKWHNKTSRGRSTKTSGGLAAIQAQLNNQGREIKKVNEKVYAAQVGYEQCKGPYYTKDCPLKEEGKTLEEAYYTQFCKPFQGGDIVQQLQDIINGITQILRTKNEEIRASTNASIRNHKALIKTLEIQIGQMSKVLHERGFGSLPSSTEMNLRDQVKSVLTTVEADSHPIRRIRSPQYAISSGQYCTLITELDLEARLMGETLVINRSLDPLNGDYIELNDINEPFELKRNQGDDLMPTNKEGEVIEKFRTRDENLDTGIDYYPRFEFTHINFFSLLYINVMSKKLHSSIIKDKMVYKGDNVVGALMNVPIFVGTFSVVTDFAVLEDMDAYRDEGMGDVIVGEPFLREVGIKARRFDGMITIYNGDDEVTYQMVRSHPRFKHHTNEQCNKIPPLLKVSEHDKMNGISHSYQKLKRFYKGVLNLGPDFI